MPIKLAAKQVHDAFRELSPAVQTKLHTQIGTAIAKDKAKAAKAAAAKKAAAKAGPKPAAKKTTAAKAKAK